MATGPTKAQLGQIEKLRGIPGIGNLIPDSFDFGVCCGSRKPKPQRLPFVTQPSSRAKQVMDELDDSMISRLNTAFRSEAFKSTSTLFGDAVSDLTGMPLALSNVFVSAFAGYGAAARDPSQIGLHIHDLALVIHDCCLADDTAKVAALFRLCVANNFENSISSSKFRMLLPLLLSSVIYLNGYYSDPKKGALVVQFESIRPKATAIEGLFASLFPEGSETVELPAFERWCNMCAKPLTRLLHTPLMSLLESPALPFACRIPNTPATTQLSSSATTTTSSSATALAATGASSSATMSSSHVSLLTQEQMWVLAGHMPDAMRLNWERAFYSDTASRQIGLEECFAGDGGVLIVIQDETGAVFGTFFRQQPRASIRATRNQFVNTVGSFVYMLLPVTTVFAWRGTHKNCVYVGEEGFGCGGVVGKMALFVDPDLTSGHTFDTETYGNSCLASFEDFEIVKIEAWVCHNEHVV